MDIYTLHPEGVWQAFTSCSTGACTNANRRVRRCLRSGVLPSLLLTLASNAGLSSRLVKVTMLLADLDPQRPAPEGRCIARAVRQQASEYAHGDLP